MMAGDIGPVARAALGAGRTGLARFAVQLFRPIRPMLAQPADDVADALGTLGRAAFEYKLDGARIQVHKGGDEVRVFSRRLNEVTGAVPEIVEAARGLPVREAIWTVKRSRCAPTAGRSRFRSPCAASAASSTSPRCAQACRSSRSSSTPWRWRLP